MTTKEVLSRNAFLHVDNVSYVDIKPAGGLKKEITWNEFDGQANRFANMLVERGIGKGNKVAIMLMSSIDWMPVYAGLIKAGSVAVPIDYRCGSDEIRRCLELSGADALIFGNEFKDRMEAVAESIPAVKLRLYVGNDCPEYAEDYVELVSACSARDPLVELAEEEYEYVW